jgi:hypothetical protein
MSMPTLAWPVITILLMATSTLLAQTYDFRMLPLPETLGTPIAEHINNTEQVVGAIIHSFDPFRGMAFQADLHGYTTFSFPGADVTVFNGISDYDEVAGHSVNIDVSHGCLIDTKGTITVVDFLGHEGGSWILDINDRGTAVGLYCDPPVPLCEGIPQGSLRAPQGGI